MVNNMDLFSYLMGKKSSGGGGGETNITSLADYINLKSELVDKFDNFLYSKFSSYPVYSENDLTLYTPHKDCKYYIIQKRANDKYRILWSPYKYGCVWTNTTVGFFGFTVNTKAKSAGMSLLVSLISDFDDVKNFLSPCTSSNENKYYFLDQYYSNDFDSLEDLITAITSSTGTITYTQYNSGLVYTAELDSPYLIPYTNIPIIDRRNDKFEVVDSRILSKNETIEVKS